jgi:hypothetical protein
MTAATLVYVDHTPNAAEVAQIERHVQRRGFSPAAPVVSEKAKKDSDAPASDGEAIEHRLFESRELLLSNESARALAKLEAAQKISDAHPELPHAAFLESELARAFAETHEALGDHAQASLALERARILDGGRVLALSENVVSTLANVATKTVELQIAVRASTTHAHDETEIWLDGSRLDKSGTKPLSVLLPTGKHHLRVRYAGDVISTAWLVLDQDTTREIFLPAPAPCSVREFESLTEQSDRGAKGIGIACRNWFSVRKVANRTFVRFCHQDHCDSGVWLGGAETDSEKRNAWIPWALTGALGASAALLTVINLQTTTRTDAKFVNGGLTLAGVR